MSNDRRTELLAELFMEVRAGQNASDAMDEAVGAYLGINRTDSRCLDIIDQHGRMTAGELALESGLTTGAITAVVDRMERAGFARRTRDVSDRRRIFVELTAEARERTGDLYAPIERRARELMADVTVEQLELFIRILRGGREINMQQAAKVRAMTKGRTMEALREARDVVRMAAKEAKQMTKEALKEAAMAARPERARRRRGEEGER